MYLIIQYLYNLICTFQVPSVTIGNSGHIDVEGLDDDEMNDVSTSGFLGNEGGRGEIDILRQDLQYSSSSSNDEDSDIEDV